MLSLQSFLREGRVVGPCWEKFKPKGPKGQLDGAKDNGALLNILRQPVHCCARWAASAGEGIAASRRASALES